MAIDPRIPLTQQQLMQFADVLHEDYPQLAALFRSVPFADRDVQLSLYEEAMLYLESYELNGRFLAQFPHLS